MDCTKHAGQRLELSKYNHHHFEGRSDAKSVSIDSPNCPEQLQQAFARRNEKFQKIQEFYKNISEHDQQAIQKTYDLALKTQVKTLNSEIRAYSEKTRPSGAPEVKELEFQSALDLFNSEVACQSDISENTDENISKRDTDDNLDNCQTQELQEVPFSLTRKRMECVVRRAAQCAALLLWTSQIVYPLADQSVGQQNSTDKHLSFHDLGSDPMRMGIVFFGHAITFTGMMVWGRAVNRNYPHSCLQEAIILAQCCIGGGGLSDIPLALSSDTPVLAYIANGALSILAGVTGRVTGEVIDAGIPKLRAYFRRIRANNNSNPVELVDMESNI